MTFEQAFKNVLKNKLQETFIDYDINVSNDNNYSLQVAKNKLYAIVRTGALIPAYDYRDIHFYNKSIMVSIMYHINQQQVILSKFEDLIRELNAVEVSSYTQYEDEDSSTTREYYYKLSLSTPTPALSDSMTQMTQAIFTGNVLIFDKPNATKFPTIKINGYELTDLISVSNEQTNTFANYITEGMIGQRLGVSSNDKTINITLLYLENNATAFLKDLCNNPNATLFTINVDDIIFKAFINVKIDYTFAGGFPMITLQIVRDGDNIG